MSRLVPGDYDAVLNGNRIHYSVRGSGPALIAHSGGPGMDARVWDDIARIHEFVSVIVMHPRGSGLSAIPPDGAYALADYAADVEALRRHLGLERPILMGWSHGGIVAQQFALTYPDSLSRLILYSTSACLGNSAMVTQAIAVQAYQDQPWYEDARAAWTRWWSGDVTTDEDVTRLWAQSGTFFFREFDGRIAQYHRRTGQHALRIAPLLSFLRGEAATLDLRPRLNDIKVPVQVIAGRYDLVTPVTMSEDIAKHLPNARLTVFEKSGHFAHVEEPDNFHQVIRQCVFDGA